MSLFKTLKLDLVSKDTTTLEKTYLDILETITDKPMKEDVVSLLQLYVEYSIQYLDRVARTLKPQMDMEGTMKFMNSILAEVVHGAGLHYYHQEGWTLIDKPLQFALDNGGDVTAEYINQIIDDIEASYVEIITEES